MVTLCTGWLPLVKMLIQQKANVCSTSKSLQTALHFAAEMGHVDVVASLLDAAGKQLIVMKDQGNWTPLHHAAEQGSVDIVELLIFVSSLWDLHSCKHVLVPQQPLAA